MVAYSFKRRFVEPIRTGLIPGPQDIGKRQTIRAAAGTWSKKRHARAGEELQLYHGMRTKECFLIGRARCVGCRPIFVNIGRPRGGPYVRIEGDEPLLAASELDAFARRDGFADFGEFSMFWYEHHHADMYDFRGVLITWEPTS